MKTIKNIIAIVAFISAVNANAQSNKPLTAIFKQSYEYEAMKNYEGAINTINSMYSETSYEINLRLGWLNYLSGKQKESISFYQKAISIMPAATEPLWGVINSYVKLENWTEVEKTYLSILKIDPKNTKANYNLGLIYLD